MFRKTEHIIFSYIKEAAHTLFVRIYGIDEIDKYSQLQEIRITIQTLFDADGIM